MLILTRRINEVLCIGEDIRLTVLEIKGSQVRIGISAPKEIPVHRKEIYDKIKRKYDGTTLIPIEAIETIEAEHGNMQVKNYK